MYLQRLGVHDRRLTVKRTEEIGFNSDTKYMEVKCKDNNKITSYLKGNYMYYIIYVYICICYIF